MDAEVSEIKAGDAFANAQSDEALVQIGNLAG